jgi:putative PEP-CTERM system TPR-repeat lipoprotein
MSGTKCIGLLSLLLVGFLIAGCDVFTSVDTRLARAQQGLEQGDYQRAMDEAKKAVAKQPANGNARVLLAAVALKSGDLPTAEQEIAKAMELGADRARVEPVRIDTLLALGRPQAAQEALDDAKNLEPAARGNFQGRILLAQGDPAGAIAAFDRVLAVDATSETARLGRADGLLLQGHPDAARQAVEALLEDRPDSGLGWLALGGIDMRQARFAEAAESLQKALAHAAPLSLPQRIQSRAGRVEALVMTGKIDDAASAQAELEKVAPGTPAALLTGARIALARGEPKTAVEALQRVAQSMPTAVGPRAMLVAALLSQGSVEQALAEAGKLVGEFPDSEQARLALSRAQLRAGRPDDAQATLQPLIDRPVPSAMAVTLAAQIEMSQGRSGTGLEFLEHGVEASPDNAQLKVDLASAYVAHGRPLDAVELLRSIPDSQASPQRDRMLVIAVAATRDPAAARAEIDRALNANKDDTALLAMAAGYYASTGDRERARSYLEHAAAVSPADPGTSLGLARLDISEGKLDAAAARVQAVLKSIPDQVRALALMAEVAARKGEPTEVERWLQEARRADPASLQPRLALLRIVLGRGDESQASQLIAEIEKAAPASAPAQAAIGDVFLETRHFDDALVRYRDAARIDGKLPQPHYGMARVQAAQKDIAAARASLNRALALVPGWAPAAEALARLEAGSGNFDAALRIAADLKRRSPDAAAPLTLEGDLWIASQRPADAVRAYEAAYSREPGGAIAVRILGARRMAQLPDPDRALRQWLEKTPGDVPARRSLASYLLGSGKTEAALAEYEKLVVAAPDDAVSLNNLAWLYSQRNDPKSLETARRAFELAPQSASVGDTYAWILVQAGEVKKGLEILAQAAEKTPNNLVIQYHYAYALNADGQVAAAKAVLQKALAGPGGGAERDKAKSLLAEVSR